MPIPGPLDGCYHRITSIYVNNAHRNTKVRQQAAWLELYNARTTRLKYKMLLSRELMKITRVRMGIG